MTNQFNGELYEQSEGVAMGSPLGPLMANTFMCSLEEQLKLRGKLPSYYKRYVGDTLTVMKDEVSAYSLVLACFKWSPPIDQLYYGTANWEQAPFLRHGLKKRQSEHYD